MDRNELTVGQLARRTGLTVRTLHHYDRIGLLKPASRTASGYRLYGTAEVERLRAIVALRALGLGLDEIARCLEAGRPTLAQALEALDRELEERVQAAQLLRDRVRRARDRLENGEVLSQDESLTLIKEMIDMEEYYTPDQLDQLEKRRASVGMERIRQVEDEWKELFARLEEARERGDAPDSPVVQELATQGRALIAEFTGGDPGIAASLGKMYRQEGTRPLEAHGMPVSAELWAFWGRAMQAGK
jgi:DNA-binding transcriptional MerR regulator